MDLIWLSLGYVSGGELTIEVPFGPCLDQANHVHAYETIIVQVDPVDGESDTEAPLGNAWRVKFDVDPATVQKLSWRIEPNSTHEFVLWPLEKKGPFPAKYTGFTLHTLRDVHLKQRDHALKPIVEQADLAKAKEEFTKLAPLYARVPKTKLRDGSSAAEFKHVLLREMLAEAAKYRKQDWRWKAKTDADKELWLKTEREWHVELVTNNKGATDTDGLSRLMEATSLWWEFVASQDFTLKGAWREEKPMSEAPFKDAAHAEQFRQNWADVQACLTDEQVQRELNRMVVERQHAFPSVRDKLKVWSIAAKSNFQEATIGDIEEAIDGVYQLYGKSQNKQRSAVSASIDSHTAQSDRIGN